VFQKPKGLSPAKDQDHAVVLKPGTSPVCIRPYRYAHHHKDEIKRQVKEVLKSGIIKHRRSPFSSPVILVQKKDNSWRMCVDYRALNKVVVSDKYLISTINELIDKLHGDKFFSKIDLRSNFHQIKVKEEDTHKTSFKTQDGHYEYKYLVMPFSLMNAPSTF